MPPPSVWRFQTSSRGSRRREYRPPRPEDVKGGCSPQNALRIEYPARSDNLSFPDNMITRSKKNAAIFKELSLLSGQQVSAGTLEFAPVLNEFEEGLPLVPPSHSPLTSAQLNFGCDVDGYYS